MRKTVLGLVLAGSAVAVAQPEFVVPDRIYASVGHECNVYFWLFVHDCGYSFAA